MAKFQSTPHQKFLPSLDQTLLSKAKNKEASLGFFAAFLHPEPVAPASTSRPLTLSFSPASSRTHFIPVAGEHDGEASKT